MAPASTTWHWDNPLPQGNTLAAAWGSASDDVWAVGAQGAMTHFDGLHLTSSSFGTADLSGIWGAAKDDVWTVGYFGTVGHFDGSSWTVAPPVTNTKLNAVWGSSSSDVWAVGNEGTVIHFDGEQWCSSPSLGSTLTAVGGTGPNDVWITSASLCGDCVSEGGLWHGSVDSTGAVSISPLVAAGDLFSVWARSPNDVWLGSESGLIHYDGQTLTEPVGNVTVNSIHAGWAATSAGVMHFDGTAWNTSTTLYYGASGVWPITDSDVWAVGDYGATTHFDGATWKASTPTITSAALTAVWGSAPDDVYAVGRSSPYQPLLHFDGSSWASVPLPPSVALVQSTVMWGSGREDIWIGGWANDSLTQPGLIHFDGESWTRIDTHDRFSEIVAIGGSSASDVWVIGRDETSNVLAFVLLHFDESRTATQASLPNFVSTDVTGLWAAGPHDLYLATKSYAAHSSTVFHGDGTSWSAEPLVDITAGPLWGSSASDIWMVGDDGHQGTLFAHRDSTGIWTTEVAPTIFNGHLSYGSLDVFERRTIFGVSAHEIYAVEGNTSIVRYDGSSWSQDFDGNGNEILGLWATNGRAYAVGNGGTILRR